MGGNENTDRFLPRLTALEESKYALRMILLLHMRGLSTTSWLVRNIPTSSETVVRCAKALETSGLIKSCRESTGRKRHVFALTKAGEMVASNPPTAWAGEGSVFGNRKSRL